MKPKANYKVSCFCGAVECALSGSPEVMAYCHCDSCRHWSGGQVNAFTLWQPDNFEIIKGADKVASFDKIAAQNGKTGTSIRKWCKVCGGHVFIEHPAIGVVDVPAALIQEFDFSPEFHVHYQEAVQRIADGLPKFKDLPAQAGGSGEQIFEA